MAALDRVAEMFFERIVGVQHAVVSALHHARAAGLAEQSLYHNGDAQVLVDLMGMHRREQPSAAGADDQQISFNGLQW